MFPKKLIWILSQIVASLLILKVLLVITMFVWGFFGPAPVPVFMSKADGIIPYLLLVQELGTTVFLYVVVAAGNALAGKPSKK
jgi:hypothetical protein